MPAKWRRGHAPFGGRDLDPEVGTTVVLLQPDPVKAKMKIANRDGFEPRLEPANPQARTLNCKPAKARSPQFSP